MKELSHPIKHNILIITWYNITRQIRLFGNSGDIVILPSRDYMLQVFNI